MESLSGNYISQLNEYQQKTQCAVEYEEGSTDGPSHNKTCGAIIHLQIQYKTKTIIIKLLLYTYVCKYVCGGREFPEACGNNKRDAKEIAAKCVYEELLKTQEIFNDNSNRTQRFVYKVVINGKEYPEGQGKSAKEAKQHAAQRAWSEINEHSGWTTQARHFRNTDIFINLDVHDFNVYLFHSESPDAQHSSKSSSESPSSSSSIVFKDSSAVSSPMAISPSVSPLDVKPKIKLAPNFHLSPNGLAGSREVGPNMNVQKPAKPSGGQTSNQATKSRFLEDFDSINPIGKGGFGRVFKARRKLENTHYAVKIVKSTKKARREVDALAKFYYANIVRYYSCWVEDTAYRHESSESYSHSDSGSDPGTKYLYIQMEFCEGDTLRAWIDKRNTSDVDYPERRTDAAQITRQVLKAVEYIHKEGLIHRDLKPLNIMFNSEGTVKVGDFGLVTAVENDNDEYLLKRTEGTGTRIYMSPEQIWENIRVRDFPPQFSSKFSFEVSVIL
ncbi:hypothetical protein cypCar_00046009 [Cyprinus carpio]|nr:hypothetical protein cypCar_00046009 [Cyprinus carpio]